MFETVIKPRVTPTQKRNLATLAAKLQSLPRGYKHFEMSTYLRTSQWAEDGDAVVHYALYNGGVDSVDCGAVACAVGHGPSAGILVKRSEVGDGSVDWKAYAARAFGADSDYDWYDEEDQRNSRALWHYLFDGDWSKIDGHHWSAAARIRQFLDTGTVPKVFLDHGWAHQGSASAARKLYRPYRINKRVPLPEPATELA